MHSSASRRFTIEILYKKFTYIGEILFTFCEGQYRGKVFILPVETKRELSEFIQIKI